MPIDIQQITSYLQAFAPLRLAESWDNVGLLVGRSQRDVHSVMTCLTLTASSVREAVDEQVDLVVTHHPLPFRPLTRLTDEATTGRLLLDLIEARVAVYSPHTAFDSARAGINQQLAEMLGLHSIQPLQPAPPDLPELGTGRCGRLPAAVPFSQLVTRLKEQLQQDHLQVVPPCEQQVERVAVGCGSAGELLGLAEQHKCQVFVTGEASFHRCLEAEATGIGLILLGHYASERFAVERLAEQLQGEFPALRVWPSRREQDPLLWV